MKKENVLRVKNYIKEYKGFIGIIIILKKCFKKHVPMLL